MTDYLRKKSLENVLRNMLYTEINADSKNEEKNGCPELVFEILNFEHKRGFFGGVFLFLFLKEKW